MFDEESLVTSLFKIFNVIVLCGAGVYFFKTRILQQIKDAIAEKKKEQSALQEEKRVMKVRLKMIEDEIIEQQSLCAKVTENLTAWNAAVLEKQEALNHEGQERIQEQEMRVKKQSEHLTKLKIQQDVLPHALANAQEDLEKNFTATRGHAYMQQLMHRMRRV